MLLQVLEELADAQAAAASSMSELAELRRQNKELQKQVLSGSCAPLVTDMAPWRWWVECVHCFCHRLLPKLHAAGCTAGSERVQFETLAANLGRHAEAYALVSAPQLRDQKPEAPEAASAAEGGKGSGWFGGGGDSMRQEVAALKAENKKLAELAARRGQVHT